MDYLAHANGLVQVFFVICMSCGSISAAKEISISADSNLKPLLKEVGAGDTIVLENGNWGSSKLKFDQLMGTVAEPIRVRARTPGKVVFSGEAEFRLSGSHVIVSGLVFRNTKGASDVFELRTHSERHAHHCRVTDCVFERTLDVEPDSESRWLSIYGTHNRIDHCYFAGKKSPGATMVVWVSEAIEKHRIDHNHFGPRPTLGRNGGETIRIGTSDVSELTCRTLVEDNYFHQCDGEAEIISNKSCENTCRHNVFEECDGAVTLRHGHRCLVDANVFLGKRKGGTGGVRIIGQGHTVTNNYFEGLRGDARRAALCVMNGIPDGPLNGFAPVRDAFVAHNTFVDCKVSLEIGLGDGVKQSESPVDCRFDNNLFLPGKWPLFSIHAIPRGTRFEGNKYQIGRTRGEPFVEFERVDLRLNRAADGLMRPTKEEPLHSEFESASVTTDIDGQPREGLTFAGCDVPGTPLYEWGTADNTGPTWKITSLKTPSAAQGKREN